MVTRTAYADSMPQNTSCVRFSTLPTLFRSDSRLDQGERLKQFDVLVARLSVLYEDLRIELMGIHVEYIPKMDVLDPPQHDSKPQDIGKTRRHYFVRRSLCTLCEIADAVLAISKCERMKTIAALWKEPSHRSQWKCAVRFFRRRRDLIRKVRNDIGGHFGDEAALFAIENATEASTAKMGLNYNDKGRMSVHLHFAGELAANAFVRQLEGATLQNKLTWLLDEILQPGYRHATNSVNAAVFSHLWHKFR